ncbi:MAG: hypothetical protein EON93_00305 [Burkholderiales bacterium]|nr:MAG: hypothetical protein EON93_00305 [Burkholderiales bacterium]
MLLLIELNEINFDQIRAYSALGLLPNLTGLINEHGLSETTSEDNYEELEPWIQWVTAHTGKPLAAHGIYRLGDIVDHDLDQIWEVLERQGVRVGAISPMNASNRCTDPAFFVPDPWTRTRVSGAVGLKRLYAPISQIVNDNAAGRMTAGSALALVGGLMQYARPANYLGYLGNLWNCVGKRSWHKAMLLDRLLADVFVKQVAATRPGFASLFLNAGAHIQHHYLFNSRVYGGPLRNPEWYVGRDEDPVLDVYALYDRVVGDVRAAFPEARVMLATGLHQDPHGSETFYWRLRDHAGFLKQVEVPFERVEPRMSRDFILFCADVKQARAAERRLNAIVAEDGRRLFAVDNRGDSLFVELIWAQDIPEDFCCRVDNQPIAGLRGDVAFVAVKNGQHNGIGYFLDTAHTPAQAKRFPLAELPARVAAACSVEWSPERVPEAA